MFNNIINNLFAFISSLFIFSQTTNSVSQLFIIPSPAPPPITILLTTGDVMLGRSVHTQSLKERGLNYPFLKIQPILSAADIVLINLENPLVNPCPNTDSGMKFCAPTEAVSALQWAGIDVVNLANNHTQNYGQESYLSTIETLTKAGIKISDSQRLSIIEKNKIKFGFMGFDMVTYPHQKFQEIISNFKKNVDVVIVSFHWGWEYSDRPNELQKRMAREAVNAGADIIIGHHPHVVQPIEVIDNAPIIYSHGNLIFDQPWSEATKKGIMVKFIFEGMKLKSYETIPIYMKNLGQPELASQGQSS